MVSSVETLLLEEGAAKASAILGTRRRRPDDRRHAAQERNGQLLTKKVELQRKSSQNPGSFARSLFLLNTVKYNCQLENTLGITKEAHNERHEALSLTRRLSTKETNEGPSGREH